MLKKVPCLRHEIVKTLFTFKHFLYNRSVLTHRWLKRILYFCSLIQTAHEADFKAFRQMPLTQNKLNKLHTFYLRSVYGFPASDSVLRIFCVTVELSIKSSCPPSSIHKKSFFDTAHHIKIFQIEMEPLDLVCHGETI